MFVLETNIKNTHTHTRIIINILMKKTFIFVGTSSLILWFKILSKTSDTTNLYYGLVLIHNGKFGKEHAKSSKWTILYFFWYVVTRILLSKVFTIALFLSLFVFYVPFLFLLSSLLYESSPFFSLLSLFTWITSDFIKPSFSGYSSWTNTFGPFFIVQACPSRLNVMVPGRWLSLMWGLLWNYMKILESYLGEVDLLWIYFGCLDMTSTLG